MKKKFFEVTMLLSWAFSGCWSASSIQEPTALAGAETYTSNQRPTQTIDSETPALLPSPTNLPKLTVENRKDLLTNFVQENGGCQLPCILGITPGVTDSLAAQVFTDYFETNSREADNQINDIAVDTFANNNWAGVYLGFFENKIFIHTRLAVEIIGDKVSQTFFFGQATQIIDTGAKKLYGDSYYNHLLKSFLLPNILETYGQPDQIIIRPSPEYLGHPSPPAQYTFGFVLFYPQWGFVVEYIAVREENADNFVGCPTKPYVLHLSSWDPNKSITMNESIVHFSNLDGISKGNFSDYKQLQDVTSLKVIDFYNTFRVLNSSECVQTPKNLWPSVIQ